MCAVIVPGLHQLVKLRELHGKKHLAGCLMREGMPCTCSVLSKGTFQLGCHF